VPYQQISVEFQLDGRSLSLIGRADPTQPSVLIASASGPILTAPPNHSVAAVSLLRALLPDRELQVPAARQTSALIGLLPIPDTAPASLARTATHTPTRLAPAATPQPTIRQPKLR
jgi:hypothetical protein